MYNIYLNVTENSNGSSLGFLRYDTVFNKSQIDSRSKLNYIGRNTANQNYLAYLLSFNGIDWEFCYIENFLNQIFPLIQNGLNSSNEEVKQNMQQLFDELKEFLSNKTIAFDYHQGYSSKFDQFEKLFGNITYFKNKFHSTNGSQRVLTLIKF